MSEVRFNNDSPEVRKLATGKKRISVIGKISVYRLRNGWTATKIMPDHGKQKGQNGTTHRN